MKNNLSKIYWFYLIGVFFILILPLLSAPPLFHPASWGKGITFRVILSILIFSFVCQVLFSKPPSALTRIKEKIFSLKSGLFLPFWSFVSLWTLFFLATVFSLDPHFSLWGSPYRGGGFITFSFFFVFAIFLLIVIRKKDWQKIIDFSLVVGVIASIIAIFQKLGWFSSLMVSYKWRPISTMGGSMFFALYLIFLIFLALALGIAAKGKKKIFYFSSFAFLLVGIILAATRAVFLGFFIGLLFFILNYPKRKEDKSYNRKLFWIKTATIILIILGILGIFGLKSQPQIVDILKQNTVFGTAFSRMWSFANNPVKSFFGDRGSGWQVSLNALKNRPWLGYGPENFSIGFDEFYDPSLPGIRKEPNGGSTGYWDRGHNFIFDIGISAGIPALIAFLVLIFSLVWQLERIKKKTESSYIKLTAHGLQITFIAYLITNFFSFDVFSTYLMLFLLISYSFYLIFNGEEGQENDPHKIKKNQHDPQKEFSPGKYIFTSVFFIVTIWFIWPGNIKPLLINKEINQYVFLSKQIYSARYNNPTLAKQQEQALLKKMDELLSKRSIIDNYLRLQYVDIISRATEVMTDKIPELSLKAIKILRECQKLRPYYTRSWIYEVTYINKYIELTPNLKKETKEELNKEALLAVKKAFELSPKRPEVFIVLIENSLINKKYQKAEEEAEKCLSAAPKNGKCWWAKALALIGLKKIKEADEAISQAEKNGYKINNVYSLGQLVTVYATLAKQSGEKKYYQKLADIYQRLIKLDQEEIKKSKKEKGVEIKENFQYHASLAYIYKVLGEYKKAREEALIVMKLSPKSKKTVEKFLETLPSLQK